MMDFKFKKYWLIAKINLELITQSPLLIKSGMEELSPSKSDSRFMRDVYGNPVIPGSTFKGFFRGNLLRLEDYFKEELINGTFGSEDPQTRKKFASNLFFSDFLPSDRSSILFENRPQIKINRKTLSTERGALLSLETLSKGAIFGGHIIARNCSIQQFALIYAVIFLANKKLIRIGFNKTRGFGQIKLNVKSIEFQLFNQKYFKIELNHANNSLDVFQDGNKVLSIAMNEEIIKEQILIKEDILALNVLLESDPAFKFLEAALKSYLKNK